MRDDNTAGNLLSTYLLQGWVMTDELCKVPGCSYPLMRSKDGSISFCTKHDELPNAPSANVKNPERKQQQQQQAMPVVGDDELRIRRERREQSSKASQLIGQKMLQRWALLNEQCPNESCYAVPLIRNPDTKKMFCVICENYILTEEEEKAMMAEKLKREPVVEKLPAIDQNQPTIEEPVSEPKLVHSPIISSSPEECKRQKVEKKSRHKHKTEKTSHKSSSSSSTKNAVSFASDVVVSRLSKKMDFLTEQVETCEDPVQLTDLFKAIKSCAGAIQACVEASRS